MKKTTLGKVLRGGAILTLLCTEGGIVNPAHPSLPAGAQEQKHSSFLNSAYIGLSGGFISVDTSMSHTSLQVDAYEADSFTLGGKGPEGGVHLGYGHVFAPYNIYVALEAKAAVSRTSDKRAIDEGEDGFLRHKLEKLGYYGLNLHLGGLIAPQTIAALKLGVVSGRWQISTRQDPDNFSRVTTPVGMEYGLLMRVGLSNSISMGLEGSYQKYSKQKTKFSGFSLTTSAASNLSLLVRISYLFKK